MAWFASLRNKRKRARNAAPQTPRSERVEPAPGSPVEVQVMGRNSLDVLRARNLSLTGIGVYVPHGFAGIDLQEEVELIVTLPGHRPFQARGLIRHRTDSKGEGEHFGLQFTQVGDAQSFALERYLHSRQAA